MLLDVFPYRARELIIYCMARLRGNHTSENGLAHQSKVADDVEQFVTCRLVVPCEGLVVDVPQTGGIHVGNAQRVGEFVVTLLWQFLLIDYDGVVEVTSLDKTKVQQRFNLTHEHKGTCRCNLCGEIFDIVKIGKLVVENL